MEKISSISGVKLCEGKTIRDAAEQNKANLVFANLVGADLRGANLVDANLGGAKITIIQIGDIIGGQGIVVS